MKPAQGSALEVFLVSLKLGLTSFGGPVAHMGYYRQEYVVRRGWIGEGPFADLVALCQFLPGPASSQVGMGIGTLRAGALGAFAAWLGFTLPSALLMMALAYGLEAFAGRVPHGLLQGLKVVAVAVVAQAVWGMARSLTPDRPRITLALLAAAWVLTWPGSASQLGAIALGGLIGWRLLAQEQRNDAEPHPNAYRMHRHAGLALLALFFALLLALPLAANLWPEPALRVIERFYRAGSLVFGGGHVVLPLLQAEVVPHWIGNETFMAGYGAAQAVPGPLLTFAAYLGTAIGGATGHAPWAYGLLALVAIFLPSFLLILGALPFWEALRRLEPVQAALRGVNAVVVGILLAALYDPVWTTGVRNAADFVVALGAFGLIVFWKVPPWAVVLLSGGVGALVL